jgi:hypothetical protein
MNYITASKCCYVRVYLNSSTFYLLKIRNGWEVSDECTDKATFLYGMLPHMSFISFYVVYEGLREFWRKRTIFSEDWCSSRVSKVYFSPDRSCSVSLLLSSLHLKMRTSQSWGFITQRMPSEASVIWNRESCSSCWVFFRRHAFISSSFSFCCITAAFAYCSIFKNFSVMYSTVLSLSSKRFLLY